MKKYLALIIMLLSINLMSQAASPFEGGVTAEGINNNKYNRVIDRATGAGIGGATITLPKERYSTKTDSQGYFELDTHIDGTSIMSVKKDSYKPYSVTITDQNLSAPLVLGIEKSDSNSLVLDSNMYHLGDNNYSDLSANAGEFRMETIGPFYTRRFILKNLKFNKPVFMVIGSIIGIDTEMARNMGQNKIANAFSSAPEVYFNGNKISEIQINGDGQKIRIPAPLIRKNQVNEITIRTGRNLMQTAYVDYDDIEFMNISFEN